MLVSEGVLLSQRVLHSKLPYVVTLFTSPVLQNEDDLNPTGVHTVLQTLLLSCILTCRKHC